MAKDAQNTGGRAVIYLIEVGKPLDRYGSERQDFPFMIKTEGI